VTPIKRLPSQKLWFLLSPATFLQVSVPGSVGSETHVRLIKYWVDGNVTLCKEHGDTGESQRKRKEENQSNIMSFFLLAAFIYNCLYDIAMAIHERQHDRPLL